jgi:hypothetical protein
MAAGGRRTPAAPGPAADVPAVAIAAADEVVRRVRPTEASERRRAEVVDYARRLVGAALGCEVRTVPCSPLSHGADSALFVSLFLLPRIRVGVFVVGMVGDSSWTSPDSVIDFSGFVRP